MEFEDIVNLVNQAAIERKGRPLKDVERLVLEGAWRHQTYSAMAEHIGGYTEDYLKKDVGPKLWRLLSDLIDYDDIRVTKRNIQNVLQHWALHAQQGNLSDRNLAALPSDVDSVSPPNGAAPTPPRLEVWSSARLDLSEFVARAGDLAQLQQWLQEEDCRTIVLWGLAGMGKTTLVARLLESQIPPETMVGYVSLSPDTTDGDLLGAVVAWLQAVEPSLPLPTGDRLGWVMRQFERRRHLLIIDQLEGLFEADQPAGTYGPGTDRIQQFFQRVAEHRHRSLVIWVSREKPLGLSQLRGAQVREYPLEQLSLDETRLLLQRRGLRGSAQDWQALFHQYGGIPLLLKDISATVQEVYQGQVSPFLSTPDPGLPRLFCSELKQGLQRLTTVEIDLLRWVALAHEPVPITTLMADMVPAPPAMAIQSLLARGLCRQVEPDPVATTSLDVPAVVRYQVLNDLGLALLQEVRQHRLGLLNRFPLVTMTAREDLQECQRRSILHPLERHLRRCYPTEAECTDLCRHLHQALRREGATSPGFGAGNFIRLCECLGVSVSGMNFADLTIWQGDLRQVDLQGADFSHARFANTGFAMALGRRPVMSFSQDGRLLATGDQEGRLLLWDMPQGKLLKILDNGQGQGIHALAFGPGEDVLAVGTETGRIWIWSLARSYPADTLAEIGEGISTLAFSPDGTVLAAGSAAGQVQLWELASGETQGPWPRHQGAIHSLVFDPQGRQLLSGGQDQRVCLWPLTQPTAVKEFQAGPTAMIRTAEFMADPAWPHRPPRAMAVGYDDQTLTIWNVETGRSYWAVPTQGQGILTLALDRCGRYLVCSYQDFSVVLWNLPQHRMCYSIPAFTRPVWSVVFSPAGQWFATGGDYTIKLWQADRGECLRSFLSQAHPVRCLTLTAAGEQLVTGHEDHTLRLWPLSEPAAVTAPRQLTGHGAAVRTLAVSPNGQWLASGADDLTIRLWRGEALTGERILTTPDFAATVLAFSPDSQWLAGAGDELPVMVWNTASGQPKVLQAGPEDPAVALAFSGDGRWLASGSREGDLALWDLPLGRCCRVLRGHRGRIHSLVFNREGTRLTSASYDGTLCWWDLTQGGLLGRWSHPDSQWPQAVTLGSHGEILAITSRGRRVEVWDVEAQNRLYQLQGHSQDVWQVAISLDHATLATVGQDDEVRTWCLDTGACLRVLHPDRPYEGTNILGAEGLSDSEETMLKALGAVVRYGE